MVGIFRTIASVSLLALCMGGPSLAQTVGIRSPQVTDEPAVTVLPPRGVQTVLGREVRSSANENMGRIVDVIVDHSGRVCAAVIDFGGFLGVGSRKIAVDWNALHFNPDKRDVITLALTRDQVKDAPEFKEAQSVVVLGAAGGLQSMDW